MGLRMAVGVVGPPQQGVSGDFSIEAAGELRPEERRGRSSVKGRGGGRKREQKSPRELPRRECAHRLKEQDG